MSGKSDALKQVEKDRAIFRDITCPGEWRLVEEKPPGSGYSVWMGRAQVAIVREMPYLRDPLFVQHAHDRWEDMCNERERLIKELAARATPSERERELESERDAYARAMKIALQEGVFFPNKMKVKSMIEGVLKDVRKRYDEEVGSG